MYKYHFEIARAIMKPNKEPKSQMERKTLKEVQMLVSPVNVSRLGEESEGEEGEWHEVAHESVRKEGPRVSRPVVSIESRVIVEELVLITDFLPELLN